MQGYANRTIGRPYYIAFILHANEHSVYFCRCWNYITKLLFEQCNTKFRHNAIVPFVALSMGFSVRIRETRGPSCTTGKFRWLVFPKVERSHGLLSEGSPVSTTYRGGHCIDNWGIGFWCVRNLMSLLCRSTFRAAARSSASSCWRVPRMNSRLASSLSEGQQKVRICHDPTQ